MIRGNNLLERTFPVNAALSTRASQSLLPSHSQFTSHVIISQHKSLHLIKHAYNSSHRDCQSRSEIVHDKTHSTDGGRNNSHIIGQEDQEDHEQQKRGTITCAGSARDPIHLYTRRPRGQRCSRAISSYPGGESSGAIPVESVGTFIGPSNTLSLVRANRPSAMPDNLYQGGES